MSSESPNHDSAPSKLADAITGWSSSPWCTNAPAIGRENIKRLIEDLQDGIGVLESNRGRLTATEIRILSILRVAREDLATELSYSLETQD